MRVGTPGFVPGRLSDARAARRIPSMSALSRMMSISPSTIARWEDGSSSPDGETLIELAKTLNVRPEFFLRPTTSTDRPVFFRSLASTLVRDLDYQRAQMAWLKEIGSLVELYVDLPSVNVPDVLGGSSYRQLRDEDIERIAGDLRRHWGMTDGPCTDVVALMERAGIVIGSIEMGTAKLDGLCSWSEADDRPYILLATDKMSFARRQMDAAHELAHAVLHRSVTPAEFRTDLKFIETQAFRLASAFLLPASTFALEMRIPSLAAMVAAKERWRVSIKAQIKRLSDLKLIPSEFSTHLYKLYSAKGWNRGEPLDDHWVPSEPHMLKDALNLIVDGGVRTKGELLAAEFSVSAGDVENLCGLPNGWFFRDRAEVVTLKPKADDAGGVASSVGGAVVPFPSKPRRP